MMRLYRDGSRCLIRRVMRHVKPLPGISDGSKQPYVARGLRQPHVAIRRIVLGPHAAPEAEIDRTISRARL